jgi:hypothetical protein
MVALALLCCTAPVWAGGAKPDSAGGDPSKTPPAPAKLTSAEQIQAALDKNITIDYASQSLFEILRHVTKKTGIPFSMDQNTYYQVFPDGGMGFGGGFGPNGPIGGPGIPGFPGGGGVSTLTIKDAPLGKGLKQFLKTKNMSYVIHNNKVLVTGEAQALVHQMKMPVDVDVSKQPLQQVLINLGKKSGVNILIDPVSAKEAAAEVSLKVEGVSLETAVRLLAFAAGMKSVRVDNVLVVTTPARAALLPAEAKLPSVPTPVPMDVGEEGMPGFPGGGVPGFPGAVPPGVDPMMVPPAPGIPPMAVPGVVNPDGTVDNPAAAPAVPMPMGGGKK